MSKPSENLIMMTNHETASVRATRTSTSSRTEQVLVLSENPSSFSSWIIARQLLVATFISQYALHKKLYRVSRPRTFLTSNSFKGIA